ncbi:MAG: DNA lyase [Akkermansiaceae bacterium]|nr:DNA lyase [Verrucomicrobiales bacterium]
MRLWTLHPQYLDARGLVALWREGLLAQKVLQGATRGYKHHPQLARFRAQPNPISAIAAYLRAVWQEAARREYNFDGSKIGTQRAKVVMLETSGQLLYEWQHLKAKLKRRDAKRFAVCSIIPKPKPHPLFKITKGPVRDWERVHR